MYYNNYTKSNATNLHMTKQTYDPFDDSRMVSMFFLHAGSYESPKAIFNKINQGFRNMLTYGACDRTEMLTTINLK